MTSVVAARSSQSQLAKSACKINPMPSIESSAARRFWPTRPLSYDKGGTSGERAIPEALRMRGARCYPPHIALHCTNPTRQIASQMMAYGVGGVPGPGDWSHFFWFAPLYPGGPYIPCAAGRGSQPQMIMHPDHWCSDHQFFFELKAW